MIWSERVNIEQFVTYLVKLSNVFELRTTSSPFTKRNPRPEAFNRLKSKSGFLPTASQKPSDDSMTTSPTVAARDGADVATLDIFFCTLDVNLLSPTVHFVQLR